MVVEGWRRRENERGGGDRPGGQVSNALYSVRGRLAGCLVSSPPPLAACFFLSYSDGDVGGSMYIAGPPEVAIPTRWPVVLFCIRNSSTYLVPGRAEYTVQHAHLAPLKRPGCQRRPTMPSMRTPPEDARSRRPLTHRPFLGQQLQPPAGHDVRRARGLHALSNSSSSSPKRRPE